MWLLDLYDRWTRLSLRVRGVTSRFAETPSGRLHLYDAPGHGDLSPVVLLHGIASSAAPLAPILSRLRPHVRRVIVPEAPGHGFSPRPTERATARVLGRAVIDVLSLELREPAIVYGNSFGGAVALAFALERPDLVRALILGSPAGAPISAADLAGVRKLFKVATRADAHAFLERVYRKLPWYSFFMMSPLRAVLANPVVREFFETIDVDAPFDRAALAKLPMPILLLWGQADRLLPKGSLDFFRSALPPETVIEEPAEFGHSPYLESPAYLAARILSFARTFDGSRAISPPMAAPRSRVAEAPKSA